MYGVPSELDTGSNESHHKPTKYAARLTQRKEATFNYQTAKRMTGFMVLDFTMHEVDGGKVVWEYFKAQLDSDDSWTDLSQEALNLDPVAMDVSLEEASKSAASSHRSVQSRSDLTDSSLLIQTGGTRSAVFEDKARQQ